MKTSHTRKNKTITEIETGVSKGYTSVNAAKRASAILQRTNGGLGNGNLAVI